MKKRTKIAALHSGYVSGKMLYFALLNTSSRIILAKRIQLGQYKARTAVHGTADHIFKALENIPMYKFVHGKTGQNSTLLKLHTTKQTREHQ